jgi:acyl carrier protein
MDAVHNKLSRCFTALFPTLGADDIPRANQESVPEWDSLAAITMMRMIEEEFDVQLDFEELENLTSFEGIHQYLSSRTPA